MGKSFFSFIRTTEGLLFEEIVSHSLGLGGIRTKRRSIIGPVYARLNPEQM